MENSCRVLLMVAICSHHFTAMSAAKIIFDPAMGLSGTALPLGLLAIAVAFAIFVIIVLTLGGVAIKIRDRRREIDRLATRLGQSKDAPEPTIANRDCFGDATQHKRGALAHGIGRTKGGRNTKLHAVCDENAADRHALLSHADTALYRAKNEGRGIYRIFPAPEPARPHLK